MTDLEIARSVPHKHIFEVAQSLGIHSDDLIPFGRYKAKIAPTLGERIQNRPLGRYILVTRLAMREEVERMRSELAAIPKSSRPG